MAAEGEFTIPASKLSPKKQIVFALWIFERMLPRTVAFCTDTGVEFSCCLQARDAAWNYIETASERRALYRSLSDACLKNAPDTEEFAHEMTSDALDAFITTVHIMQFILDGRFDHITSVSTLATDSVDGYLANLEPGIVMTKEIEARIASHPLMREELQRQKNDVEFLAALPDHFDNKTITALKERSSRQPSLVPLAR